MSKERLVILCVLSVFIVLNACATNNDTNADQNGDGSNGVNNAAQATNENEEENEALNNEMDGDPEPVELTFYFGLVDSWEGTSYAEWIEEKFPHVTINHVTGDLEELMAQGTVPDIIRPTDNTQIPNMLFNNELEYDLTELIETHNFDLSRIREDVLDGIRAYGENDEIYVLPHSVSTYGLFYNKDIFDTFGVSYPENDMTWNELLELSEPMTREEDGVNYLGLDMSQLRYAYSQLSSNLVDENGNVDLVNHEEVQVFMDMFERIYNVPPEALEEHEFFRGADMFGSGKVAMVALQNISSWLSNEERDYLNWGVVTYPYFEERPGFAPLLRAPSLGISPVSDKKDEAFEIITSFLSEEFQAEETKDGRFAPAVNDLNIDEYWPVDEIPSEPFVTPAYAEVPFSNNYSFETEALAQFLNYSLPEYVHSGQDRNEFLRETNDKIEQALADLEAIQ